MEGVTGSSPVSPMVLYYLVEEEAPKVYLTAQEKLSIILHLSGLSISLA